MDIDSLAQALFGSKRAETQEVSTDGTTRTYAGVALTDSEDGTVVIDLGGDVTLPDDLYDSEGNVVAEWDGVGVEMPTSPQVSAGDDVIVTLMGGSATKTPMVTSSAGSGDRMRALVNAAQTVADAAQAVAEAVNQHFFADTNGIHVTEATQEDWDESHTGANVLINSVGQLFRDGLNNLLTLTTQNGARALTIWDGLGNSASNILARFSSDGISFADGTSFDIGDSSAYINFDGNGHISIGGSGLTIGGYATDDDVTNAINGISVGGRNLLRNTGNPTASDLAFTRATVQDGIIIITPTTYAGYAKFIVDYLDFDDYGEGEYTFSFDAKAVSGATYTNLKGPVAYAGFNVASRMSNASFSSSYDRYKSWMLSPTLAYDWTRYTQTFTVPDDLTTGQASALASGSNLTVVVAMTGSYAPMMVRNVKLERGNKATDWTPALEDVDADISDAAKTATSYVTEITGQNGIMVHPSTDQTTGVQITSDVDILRGGTSVANYGTTARIGTSAGKHVSIDSDSVDLMDGSASLATFGANDTHIGMSGTGNVYMANDKFLLSATTSEWETSDSNPLRHVTQEAILNSTMAEQVLSSNCNIHMTNSQEVNEGGSGGATVYIGAGIGPTDGNDPEEDVYASVEVSADLGGGSSITLIADQISYTDPYGGSFRQLGKPQRLTASGSYKAGTSDTMGPHVTLTAGIWFVEGIWAFANSSSSSKKLTVGFYRSSTGGVSTYRVHTTASSNAAHRLEVVDTLVVSAASETVTLCASSSPASTSASTQYINAIRLA